MVADLCIKCINKTKLSSENRKIINFHEYVASRQYHGGNIDVILLSSQCSEKGCQAFNNFVKLAR